MNKFMTVSLCLVLVLFAVIVSSEVQGRENEVTFLLNGWTEQGVPDQELYVTFGIALFHNNVKELENVVQRVSDPAHAEYGRHLSVEAMSLLVGRSDKEVESVVSWVQSVVDPTSQGTKAQVQVSPTKDYISVTASVKQVESLLKVRLSSFIHPSLELYRTRYNQEQGMAIVSKPIIRTRDQPYVPYHLSEIVEMFSSIHHFPPIPSRYLRQRNGEQKENVGDPGDNVTPHTLWKQYNIPQGPMPHVELTSAAVAEFEQAYFYPSDLASFQKQFGLTHIEVNIIGKNDPKDGYLGEASLDVQYMSAIGDGMSIWDFSQDAFDLLAYWNTVLSTPGAPFVHSFSWGSAESGYPADQKSRWNQEFMKVGAMGYSLFAASGDDATGHTGFFNCGVYDPTFPASSPYITAVGGTYLSSGSETTWSLSGSGFSNAFPTPSYQQSLLKSYLDTNSGILPASEYWNASGRAMPDIAALATNYQVISTGYMGSLSGTSAATPVIATMIARMNAIRNSTGKARLGFINPVLYAMGNNGTVGTDIIHGESKDPSCPSGFPASPGWDVVSGFGTPLYETFLKIFT